MHRTGASSGSGSGGEVFGPSPYVTSHPHPNVKRIATAIVAGSKAPVWEHQCTTRIPNHYLQSQVHNIMYLCVYEGKENTKHTCLHAHMQIFTYP